MDEEKETNLSSCPLSPHRQAQRMTSAAVSSSLLHTLDVIQNFSAQVVLNLHFRQHGCEVEDLLVGQLADAAGRVDVEPGHETSRSVVANSKEGLERFLWHELHVRLQSIGLRLRGCVRNYELTYLEQVPLGEVDTQDENLSNNC